jgi:acid phosphatase type 7
MTLARSHARTVAGFAAMGLLAALLWACASPSPTALPSSPTAAPSPGDTVLGAVGYPTASGSPSPTLQTSGPTSSPTARSAAAGGGAVKHAITAPRPGVNVSIVAAGDIACDPAQNKGTPQDCDQAATADLIGQIHPTAVLTLGDNQYEDGTLAAFQAVFAPTWGKYKSIMYPAIGNHEYLTHGASGYFTYFGVPAYYSYNLGDWHMISLDSECSYVGGCQTGSAQERWLQADLAANATQCTLVYWHEPRWSSGEHHDATQMSAIWADLVAAHVSVVLSGHNHDYERFAPLDANGQPDPGGPTEFVVGTGGKNHYGFTVAPLAGELVRNDQSFGVIKMTLGPTSYSWSFVPAPGYTFHDSGSAGCVG